MNGKIVKRIKKAIAALPAMSETITYKKRVFGRELPKEYTEANPGKYRPDDVYKYEASETKPISHIDRAKDAYLRGGDDAVAAYVSDTKKAYALIQKEKLKASREPGAIEKANRNNLIV